MKRAGDPDYHSNIAKEDGEGLGHCSKMRITELPSNRITVSQGCLVTTTNLGLKLLPHSLMLPTLLGLFPLWQPVTEVQSFRVGRTAVSENRVPSYYDFLLRLSLMGPGRVYKLITCFA